jgi:hypothetical protein
LNSSTCPTTDYARTDNIFIMQRSSLHVSMRECFFATENVSTTETDNIFIMQRSSLHVSLLEKLNDYNLVRVCR